MSRLWSPFVADLAPYVPGEQPGGQAFVKLNTNENPYGPSPEALLAVRAAADDGLRLYPDPEARDLAVSIALRCGVPEDHVFVGNGSDEVLAHAFNAFFRRSGPVLFPDITYSFYPTYCRLYGIPFEALPLDEDFRLRIEDYDRPSAGVVIANPNAPTGIAVGLAAIRQVLRSNPDAVVIVDEAYVDFGADSALPLIADHDNLLVVRTFSKSRSLAGLRVGFALGRPSLISALKRVKNSFNSYPLGRPALAGALASWRDQEWFERTRSQIMHDRQCLSAALVARGFHVLPSQANFLFCSLPGVEGAALTEQLRSAGFLVRRFDQPRITNWLRISIGSSDDCRDLVAALDRCL